MFDLTRIALEKRRITVVAMLVVFAAGGIAYRDMPRAEDPGFIVRTAMVQTVFPGASPGRVEMLVTDKLERVIQEIPELDTVRSSSKVGVSVIYVDIREEYKDMRPVWDDLRRKVDRARADLPEGVRGPFVNDEFGDVYGIQIAVTGDGYSYRELEEVADEVRDELLLIADAAKVEVAGAQKERIFGEFDNTVLSEYGLSPLQLRQALEARNIVLPGGDITTEYEQIVLEPSGSFASVDDIRNTLIRIPASGEIVRLSDVLEIRRGYIDPPEQRVRYNGEPSLILAVSMREGGNIIELGEAVREVLERVRGNYPIGLDLDVLQFQPDVVDEKIDDFVSNLVQAVLVVGLVMLAFLGVRTGLVVASLVPAAILSSFALMGVFGIGLDQVSLAALIIALGMLVDNAIVMSESIMVRMRDGEDGKTAALASARELRTPLLISSLTTSAAFLPIFLAESSTGEYTAPLFKVVTITLLSSWVIALTLIPLLCITFLRIRRRDPDEPDGPAMRRYDAVLRAVLARPVMTLAAVVAVFALSLYALRWVPDIFFPPNDRTTFTAELELPVGSPIEATDAMTAELESFIATELADSPERDGVEQWAAFVGQGAPRFILPYNPEPPNPSYALILGHTGERATIDRRVVPEIESFVLERFPPARVTVRPLPLGEPAWPPIAIRLKGRDTERLYALLDEVKARLRETPGAAQVTDDWGARTKKVEVRIDETRAQQAGVTNQDVAIAMQTYLSGLETTEFREEDDLIPIVLRSAADERLQPDRLGNIAVYAHGGSRTVPLSQVAVPEIVWQPGVIKRRDRQRTMTAEALLEPGYTSSEVIANIEPWLREVSADWPFGITWSLGGEAETSAEANASIMAKLPFAVMLIVLLLVVQFDSVRKPVIILTTIPLAFIGVIAGLLIARSYFGFMTLLGVISLAGIVINNAIVLLDRIRIEQEENGLGEAEAVVAAGRQRARPILLTAATTIGGLIPLWIGGGPMWEPMAIAIIFGLAFATVLTLGVVPVLYRVLYRTGDPAPP
ncbi:MAG: MMPL family transporter [Gammaproteobacteria bacterium]|jgi:multidrug efflux pump subunit AcrB|nr:MMPL family transporter [Gammaproteobacteria bacterium]